MKNITCSALSLFLLSLMVSAGFSGVAQPAKANNDLVVAFYGRPGAKSLGVLGQYSIDDLPAVVQAKAKEYEGLVENAKVIPAFDIIFDLATAEPGGGGDYISSLSEEKIMPYIKLAEKGEFLLFLDLQLGKNSPLNAVKPVLKYLSYPNVHIAIDPEFEVLGLDKAPGKVIGSIDGRDVNQVQAAMRDYMQANDITEEKILVVHMFTDKMVTNKKTVKPYKNIQLIMNLDGHGSPALKINIYNGLYTDVAAKANVIGGFKLFFNEDKPMMTPKEALGIESVGGKKMREMPRYINYQ